jgi:hypothetical protein
MTVGSNSLELEQNFTSSGCCVAPYANIGIFDGCQASDQYGQAGSHLPLQLKDIAQLKGAWTFQVPMPLKTDWTVEQYRVYFEMFLSSTAEGHSDAGNITIDFFWNNFGFNAVTGHAAINGSQGMDYVDNGNQYGQGPFIDFLYPQGTYTPDTNGVVTVTSTDVKAVLDWAVAKFPNYYTSNLYLATLSLAEEAGAFHGTVKTTYASFEIQKTGSNVVYTPPFTANHWTGTGTGASSATGGSSGKGGSTSGDLETDAGVPSGSSSNSNGCSCRIAPQVRSRTFLGALGLCFGAGLLASRRARRRASRAE